MDPILQPLGETHTRAAPTKGLARGRVKLERLNASGVFPKLKPTPYVPSARERLLFPVGPEDVFMRRSQRALWMVNGGITLKAGSGKSEERKPTHTRQDRSPQRKHSRRPSTTNDAQPPLDALMRPSGQGPVLPELADRGVDDAGASTGASALSPRSRKFNLSKQLRQEKYTARPHREVALNTTVSRKAKNIEMHEQDIAFRTYFRESAKSAK